MIKHDVYAHLGAGTGQYDVDVYLPEYNTYSHSVDRHVPERDPLLLQLENAHFDVRPDFVKPYGAWQIYLKTNVTDEEHDRVYFASIILAAPHMLHNWDGLTVVGLATELKWWPSMEVALQDAESCDSDAYHVEGTHPMVRWYTPPVRKELVALENSFVYVTLRS